MENPKAVYAFFITIVVICLLAALFLSVFYRDAFIFLDYLVWLVNSFLVLAAVGIIIGVMTFPLMWLLSRWGGPKPKGEKRS